MPAPPLPRPGRDWTGIFASTTKTGPISDATAGPRMRFTYRSTG